MQVVRHRHRRHLQFLSVLSTGPRYDIAPKLRGGKVPRVRQEIQYRARSVEPPAFAHSRLALAAGYETNAQSLPGVRAFVGQPDTIPLPGRKSGAANPGCRRLSAGAPALFHEIPRAAGPLQQATKTDRLSHHRRRA